MSAAPEPTMLRAHPEDVAELANLLKTLRDHGVQQFDGLGIKVAFAPTALAAQPRAAAPKEPIAPPAPTPPAPRDPKKAEEHFADLEAKLKIGSQAPDRALNGGY